MASTDGLGRRAPVALDTQAQRLRTNQSDASRSVDKSIANVASGGAPNIQLVLLQIAAKMEELDGLREAIEGVKAQRAAAKESLAVAERKVDDATAALGSHRGEPAPYLYETIKDEDGRSQTIRKDNPDHAAWASERTALETAKAECETERTSFENTINQLDASLERLSGKVAKVSNDIKTLEARKPAARQADEAAGKQETATKQGQSTSGSNEVASDGYTASERGKLADLRKELRGLVTDSNLVAAASIAFVDANNILLDPSVRMTIQGLSQLRVDDSYEVVPAVAANVTDAAVQKTGLDSQ